MTRQALSVFWFRRDLRLEDNHALYRALNGGKPVLPIFIFDSQILDELEKSDARVSFIHNRLTALSQELKNFSSSIYCINERPINAWKEILDTFEVADVYTNEDYEPYALERDQEIKELLSSHGIEFHSFKDQVLLAKNEVLKADQQAYTVFTPYKNKWLETFHKQGIPSYPSQEGRNYHKCQYPMPTLEELGFVKSEIEVKDYTLEVIGDYANTRNIPSVQGTSYLSPHLRFGTVSVRRMIDIAQSHPTFLSELIWREFFMQILYHFPHVVKSNFRTKYDFIPWRNKEEDFEKWKSGNTGYPMVDAGMRQLNATGYMHNRVRMVTAGFLCKHLLIDWRWGEAYFASKLLDYELASNNGNWQWAAGTGCDAAPYFRVFNPTEQIRKFDPELKYIRRWIPEYDTLEYPTPMVEHKYARERAIKEYKVGISRATN